jgi:sulfide:quinone oxidoreductase
MRPYQLTADYSVSGQIKPADVAGLAAMGYKSIICNRPDNEGFFQPVYADIEKAAKEAGLECRFIPLGRPMTGDPLGDTIKAIKEMPKPILAYCASGNRSQQLFMAASRGR